jgi:type II secretory pathway pseudopilin PulG
MTARRLANGFTIVELLVVAAIMATLFGLILASGRASPASEVRRAARQIAAVLLSAQSRAIGSRIGAAVLLESDGDPARIGATPPDPKNDRAVNVRDAEMAPAITAEVVSPYQTPPLPPNQATQTPQYRPDLWVVPIPTPVVNGQPVPPPIVPENARAADLDSGFRIQFSAKGNPWSDWYGFLPRGEDRNVNGKLDAGEDLAYGPESPKDGKLDTTPLVTLRFSDGQTAENSIWPATLVPPPEPPTYRIEVSRYPGIGTVALPLPSSVAIDLRYSGHGDDAAATSTWGRLASKGVVGLSFDTVGRVDLLMQNVTGHGGSRAVQPLVPSQTIYVLVVSRDELEAEGAGGPSTLASDTSLWVAIEPQSGRVHVAANEPQALSAGATPTIDQLRAARRLARSAITLPK